MMTASESIHERLGLYDVALHTFLEKPLLGFGVEGADETLVAQYTALGMMDAAESNYNPHNQYLQTLVELGLLGACVFLLLLVVIIRNGMPRALTIRVFVVFLLFFVVESALQRLPGIASFTAFAMIFASINSKEAQGD
ncbi:MAG: O-antigen ligase family protein [Bacteroidota bacterium]